MKKDSVLFWNEVALNANKEDHSVEPMLREQPGPAFSSRALAIIHAAIFDASNSFYKYYSKYRYLEDGILNADSAVAGAALSTLKNLYQNQSDTFEGKLQEFKNAYEFEQQSFDIGLDIGNRIYDERKNDNSDLSRSRSAVATTLKASLFPAASNSCTVCKGGQPGQHVPFPEDQGCYGERWGEVTPFAIANLTSVINTVPPHPLGSEKYYQDFDEVYKLGKTPYNNPDREVENTYTGLYWAYDGAHQIGTPPRLYNQVAHNIAIQENLESPEIARLFLFINLALADAGIHCWFSKYKYCLWRPVVGIRNEEDANRRDPNWLPYGAPSSNTHKENFTPNFPAYPSGHATFGTAALTVMKKFLKERSSSINEAQYQIIDFISDELNEQTYDRDFNPRPKVTRTFTLNEGIRQNLESRIYLGVHWRMDGDEGARTGELIAGKVFEQVATKETVLAEFY